MMNVAHYALVAIAFASCNLITLAAVLTGRLLSLPHEILLIGWASVLKNTALTVLGNWLLIAGFIEFGFGWGLVNGLWLFTAYGIGDGIGGYSVVGLAAAMGIGKRLEDAEKSLPN